MSNAAPEPGSYRDRRGRIFTAGGRVFRTVMPDAIDDFEFVRSTGLVDDLVKIGKLVDETIVDKEILGDHGADAALVLEHSRLPLISYPYEWCFSALQDAALLHLDIQLAALDRDVTLTDASAYNVQFDGARPVFIDHLSFRRYEDGEFWAGHRQFCEQFINPLLLRSIRGLPHNAWYRGTLEGISAEELAKVLPWRSRFSWQVLTNVFMQAKLQRTSGSSDAIAKAQSRRLPKIGFEQMLRSLRSWIAKLKPRTDGQTVWEDYATDNSYDEQEAAGKRSFVADFVTHAKPDTLLDVGCNTGDYSVLALESGAARVIGFDFDHGALEFAYRRARADNLSFLPLLLDAANPSPGQGWQESERAGFSERAKGDAVVALALIHHLAIARNVPLDQVLDWLLAMAPTGVIEFVPKGDPMVKRLLQMREDIFDDYDPESFEALLTNRSRIVRSEVVSASGRTLYWFDRD